MNKILFPTDFSDNAKLALPFVLEFARTFSSEVIVLHTYQLPYHRSDMFVSVTDIMKKDAEEAIDKLMAELTAMPDAAGIKFTPVVRVGDVVDACKDLIEEQGVGIVILGTTGATGLEEVFLGSNAASVIDGVDIPVLAIPGGNHNVKPSTLCLAYDLDNPGAKALLPLHRIATTYKSRVLVLNVNENPEKDTTDMAAAGVHLGHALEGLNHEFFLAEDSDVEESLNKFINEYKPDWIVLVHHHRGFFQRIFSSSLTKKVAYHTKLPLLALHQPKEK